MQCLHRYYFIMQSICEDILSDVCQRYDIAFRDFALLLMYI